MHQVLFSHMECSQKLTKETQGNPIKKSSSCKQATVFPFNEVQSLHFHVVLIYSCLCGQSLPTLSGLIGTSHPLLADHPWIPADALPPSPYHPLGHVLTGISVTFCSTPSHLPQQLNRNRRTNHVLDTCSPPRCPPRTVP